MKKEVFVIGKKNCHLLSKQCQRHMSKRTKNRKKSFFFFFLFTQCNLCEASANLHFHRNNPTPLFTPKLFFPTQIRIFSLSQDHKILNLKDHSVLFYKVSEQARMIQESHGRIYPCILYPALVLMYKLKTLQQHSAFLKDLLNLRLCILVQAVPLPGMTSSSHVRNTLAHPSRPNSEVTSSLKPFPVL